MARVGQPGARGRWEARYLRNLSSCRATFLASSGMGKPSCSRYLVSLMISLSANGKLMANVRPLSELSAPSSGLAETWGATSLRQHGRRLDHCHPSDTWP